MSMKKKNAIGVLSALSFMAISSEIYGSENTFIDPIEESKSNIPRYKVIPKGCKEYYFNSQGQWDTSDNRQYHITREETVFITVASSPKKAIEKFNKYYNKN